MSQCDLCGREETLSEVVIEGSTVLACRMCSSFGETVFLEKAGVLSSSNVRPKSKPQLANFEVICEDYGRKIKEAREKKGLTQEELALQLKERHSLIQHVEAGRFQPSVALAQKLEKFFNITLVETYTTEQGFDFSKGSLTIGDLLKQFKSKNASQE